MSVQGFFGKLIDKYTSLGRYWTLGIIFGVLLVSLIYGMLSMIMGDTGKRWREIGRTINKPAPQTLHPLRGAIYAADDRPIALTGEYYKAYFDFQAAPIALLHNDTLKMPKDSLLIRKKKQLSDSLARELDKLADALEQSFTDQDLRFYTRETKQQMRARWRKGFHKRNRYTLVCHEEMSYLHYLDLKEREPLGNKDKRAKRSLLSKIISIEDRSRRINPFGSLALRTIGSVYSGKEGGLSQGKQGIELYYDSLLRGKTGRAIQQYAARQYNKRVVEPAIDGASVYTTLDMNKQNKLEQVMRTQLAALGARSGSAILMEVGTGKILAITNLERVKGGEYAETRNFAVSDMSEPGSTFKVASMLVALNDGLAHPTDTIDVGNGVWEVAGRKVRDHNAHRGGYGKITASEVIHYSSNVGVAKIIHKYFERRPDEFVDKVRALGFGYNLQVEIPGSAQARIRKRSDNPSKWYGTTLSWMSFGYETQIPPLYTAAFFNAIAADGRFMEPYLVREIRSADHTILLKREPKVLIEQIAKPEAVRAIQEMLRGVVVSGTGKALNSEIVSISGKSGTAQIARGGGYNGPDGKSHEVSFCGYFPSEAPRYTLMVVVREPSSDLNASGGSMAGPVVKELAESLISMEKFTSLDSLEKVDLSAERIRFSAGRKSELQHLLRSIGLPHTPNEKVGGGDFIHLTLSGQEKLLPINQGDKIPSVVGMSAIDAHYLLMHLGYKVRLEGYGAVTAQSIPAGSTVRKGSTITLTLG